MFVGGVLANNPCKFAMKEINMYDQYMGIQERHFLLAMSVGTGIYPDKTLEGGEWGKEPLLTFISSKYHSS